MLFSYGSGCIASLFSLKCKLDTNEQKNCFENLHQSAVNAYKRLEQRLKCTPNEFAEALQKRENLISKKGLIKKKKQQTFIKSFI